MTSTVDPLSISTLVYNTSSVTTPNGTGNQTNYEENPVYVDVIVIIMYVLVIIVAMGGNMLFSYVIVMRPKLRSVTNLFLLNLAFSDILKSLVCIPFTFMANMIYNYWPYGALWCPVVSYMQVVTVFQSSFTLVAMCIDRYVAIRKPLRPKLSKRAFTITMMCIWALSFIIPIPTAYTSSLSFVLNAAQGHCTEDFSHKNQRILYSVTILVLQYFIPLFIIAFTNVHIGYIVWIKETPGEAERDRDRRVMAGKRRLVKMIIIMVVIYAVCWLPLHTIQLFIEHMSEDDNTLHMMRYPWMAAHWLAMSHSCYNPIVYFCLNTSFRHSLKKLVMMCRYGRGRLRYTPSMRSSGGWENSETTTNTQGYNSRSSMRSVHSSSNVKSHLVKKNGTVVHHWRAGNSPDNRNSDTYF